MIMQIIVLLSGLAFVIGILVLIYYLKTRWLHQMPKFIQRIVTTVERKLMFNSILRALLEQYFALAISTLYHVKNVYYGTFEENINTMISWLTLGYILVFPFFTYRF